MPHHFSKVEMSCFDVLKCATSSYVLNLYSAAFSEMERELIKERVKAGLDAVLIKRDAKVEEQKR